MKQKTVAVNVKITQHSIKSQTKDKNDTKMIFFTLF